MNPAARVIKTPWDFYLDAKDVLYGARSVPGARRLGPRLCLMAVREGRRRRMSWRQLAGCYWRWADPFFGPGRGIQRLGDQVVNLGERIAEEHDPKLSRREDHYSHGIARGIEMCIHAFTATEWDKTEAVAEMKRLAESYEKQ